MNENQPNLKKSVRSVIFARIVLRKRILLFLSLLLSFSSISLGETNYYEKFKTTVAEGQAEIRSDKPSASLKFFKAHDYLGKALANRQIPDGSLMDETETKIFRGMVFSLPAFVKQLDPNFSDELLLTAEVKSAMIQINLGLLDDFEGFRKQIKKLERLSKNDSRSWTLFEAWYTYCLFHKKISKKNKATCVEQVML